MAFFSRLIQNLLEFVFPPCCLTCEQQLHKGNEWICSACWEGMDKVKGAISDGVIEYDCIDEIRSALYYDRKLQTLIHYFKYQRALALADRFGALLADIVKANDGWKDANVLIPVPLHKIKLRERSYNQSEVIAQSLSEKSGIPCRTNILFRVVNTVSQTQMEDAQERVKNMEEVFEVRNTDFIKNRTAIVVDDLITTGSTANACARVLKEQGCSKVYVLTVGRPYF